ncbi:M20 aminoacylase family protein [Uliginosibacterium gangwonense]|uniref:M20 aminoacylase family protein n=1 Tax=Uliginosibacterium gangwonense TaxID=392736 RepID=UPI00035CFBEC|nr:M20 aminoacylase family protein [Uliginosibacterium gangwonense]
MKLVPEIVARQAELTRIRHDIHAHPELAYQEKRTSALVAERLKAWGIEVHEGLGGTGLVGVIRNGNSPRMIALRADMDALPIEEANSFAHRSQHAGCMHACGHDGHTTMLLGAAEYLASHRDFDGTVVLVFQPAEEGQGGAAAMIADGFFERFPVQSIYGMHNWPGMPAGHFGIAPGAVMASADRFDIQITGRGAHAAMPHQGTDTVLAGCQLVSSLQMIAARTVDPLDAAVVSVTQFHAGDAYNVMPERAALAGTVRALGPQTRDFVLASVQRVCDGIAAAYGVGIELSWKGGYYPATINTLPEAQVCREVAEAVAGQGKVEWAPLPSMGAEDFSFFLQHRPGCYVWLGNGPTEGGCLLHNPSYDFNDDALVVGASYWVRLAEALLKKA